MAKYLFVQNYYKDRVDKYSVDASTGALTFVTSLLIDNVAESPYYFTLKGEGNYLYAALDNTVYKIDANTMTITTQRTMSNPNYFIALHVGGNYLYLTENTGLLYRISKNDLTGNSTLDLSSYATGGWFFPLQDSEDSNVLWVAYGKYPPYYDCGLLKVNVTTFSIIANEYYHREIGLSWGRPQDVAQDANYVYFNNDIGEVLQISKSTMAIVDWYESGDDYSHYPFPTGYVNRTTNKLYCFFDAGWLGCRIFNTTNMAKLVDFESIIDSLGLNASWDGGGWTWGDGIIYLCGYNYLGNDYIWVTNESGAVIQFIDLELPSSGPNAIFGLELAGLGDCETKIKITGLQNKLCVEAIDWSEEQVWQPAIRDVPNKSDGQKIDTAIKVNKPKTLNMTVRLSDSDVATMKLLFEEHVTVAIEATDDNGGTWTYSGWFSRKPFIYDYKKEKIGVVKEWKASLEFTITSSEYEAA